MTRANDEPPGADGETRADAVTAVAAARVDVSPDDASGTARDRATGPTPDPTLRPTPDPASGTARDRAKADRRAALLAAAARLFAERGFDGVTLGDIGEAAGVSGPAVYRHVSGKQALLGAILVDVSERLLEGGRRVAGSSVAPTTAEIPPNTPSPHDRAHTASAPDRPADRSADAPIPAASRPRVAFDVRTTAAPADTLRALVDFHVAFALAEADVIRVQDRDLDRLSPDDRRTVRDLQNAYVAVWTEALATALPDAETPAERRVRALACFGLINSTPHSVRGVPAARVRPTLTRMALAALTA
ncbi:AcrR family transcriptional regulator [Microbacterium testaceum]|uniref:TetR/AcrR family transcriptional regulator n=1 Tax=Microbacterium testaceum TaxID=2033 RepID=UPI00278071C6|nr:TetR/AcrR family transcriptional regulator [Microbacterium testaceum]MDQ1173679.1 AcrR family transcriptional regulator [Microbacterium testaceum]